MQNIILISHGSMAEGVKASLEMIVGKQDHVHVVALTPEGDNRQFEEELLKKMKALNGSSLIIADLLGGTPCNVALSNYLESENVEIIAGMSLPSHRSNVEFNCYGKRIDPSSNNWHC